MDHSGSASRTWHHYIRSGISPIAACVRTSPDTAVVLVPVHDGCTVLMFVIPYDLGVSHLALTSSILPSRYSIASPSTCSVPGGRMQPRHSNMMIRYPHVVSCLSGLALLSEPGSGHPTTARIHVNGAAIPPLMLDQVRSISPNWVAVSHPAVGG